MKRVLHEESEEEERLQGLVRALDSVGEILTFGFEELDTMLRAFRFHPQRLLRLMQSSSAVNQAVEMALAHDPRFWYDSCVAAFPDVIIMMETCNRLHDFSHLTYRIVSDNPRVYDNLFLSQDYYSAWHFFATPEEAEDDGGDAELFNLAVCHSFATANNVDEDFTNPSRWHDRFSAEQMAQHFAFFYPYALPPAEYCFLSRVKAQRMQFELLGLMPVENAIAYAQYHGDNTHNVYKNYCTPGSWREKLNLATAMYWRYFERDAQAKEVFDLANLAREIARLVQQVLDDEVLEGEGLTLGAVPSALALFKRVRAAQLLHSDAAFVAWESGAATGDYQPGVADLTYAEYGQTLREGREELLRLYGRLDPLYWDVLMTRPTMAAAAATTIVVDEEGDLFDVKDEMDWKRVVVTQLEWVKRYAPKTHPIHKAIQSTIPDTAFACHTCGASQSLSVQSCAPFGIYCGDGCLPT